MQLDETVTDQKRDEKEKIREQKRAESKQAQALALKLAERIDTLAEKTEKPKHQNGYEVFNFNIKGCFRFNDVKSNGSYLQPSKSSNDPSSSCNEI